MRIFLSLFMALSAFSFTFSEEVKVKEVTFNELESQYLNAQQDTVLVVNFWATWCAPCVKELPSFQEALDSLSNQPVKFLFVSLDFPNRQAAVEGFVKAKKLNGEFVRLTDADPNEWINKINPDWQGDIPATIIFNKSSTKRWFHSGTLSKKEFLSEITKLIQS